MEICQGNKLSTKTISSIQISGSTIGDEQQPESQIYFVAFVTNAAKARALENKVCIRRQYNIRNTTASDYGKNVTASPWVNEYLHQLTMSRRSEDTLDRAMWLWKPIKRCASHSTRRSARSRVIWKTQILGCESLSWANLCTQSLSTVGS